MFKLTVRYIDYEYVVEHFDSRELALAIVKSIVGSEYIKSAVISLTG